MPATTPKKLTPSQPELRRRVGLMTPAELAGLLEVSEWTLFSWRHTRQGPRYTRLQSKIYYREEDLVQWVDENVMREAAGGKKKDAGKTGSSPATAAPSQARTAAKASPPVRKPADRLPLPRL